jgi:peptidase M1-like protein/CopC domain-containing protein
MTDRRRVVWAGCLVALAGSCLPARAQEGVIAPESVDGKGFVDEPGTCGRAKAAMRLGTHYLTDDPFGGVIVREAANDTDVLNCNLDIEIAPGPNTIAGSNTMTVKSKVDGLTQFTFRLRSNLAISSAIINGATPAVVTRPTVSTCIATLDRAYNRDEVFTLQVSYSGVPFSPSGSFGTVEFTTQNGMTLFDTLSEPYFADTWWPCKDGDEAVEGDNSDKFTAQVAVTAPDTMVSVSNGLPQGVDIVPGNKKRYRWATAYPLPSYLLFVSSTPYTQWQQTYTYPLPGGGNGTMPVHFSIFPASDTPANRAAWEKCLQMMAAYRPFYGEYPFVNEKYGIYQFGFSGGMEHQTYTGQGFTGGTPFNESITSHELGHQWWGDNVTCKTWHDIWLNEGFATFTEALWVQYRPGSTGWPAYFTEMQNSRPGGVSQSVYRTNISTTSIIFSNDYSYLKPGWVIHTLRNVVGDTTFWNILAAYRATYQGSAATTEDFKNVASSVYGQDLSWFINEWIMGPGAPAYASGWQTFAVNGQNYLRLRIRQSQTAYPVFTMPLDVRINRTGGPEYARVWNNAASEWYVLPIGGPATGIVLLESAVGGPWVLATANAIETYVNGPPKIIQASVDPGATIPVASSPSQITITFSENVTPPAAAFSLVGPGGAMPLGVSYNAANFTVTLDAGNPLSPGNYTLAVQDTVVSAAASIALDGEMGNPPPPAPPRATPFPSGEGQPGGSASWAFTVQGYTCYPNCDNSTAPPVLNVADFTCFLQRFAAGDPYANCDGSTAPPVLNVADFTCFLQSFAAGCR